ncbi:hypothetical protein [Hyphomicrobium sp.]|uniref:hypothetical protein n=1 Tax=Hyphomicrobium sp. TaxID=82 RepID=UPI0025C65C2F|nr:hypothetical protein [Hyphomicrobium sp.]
MAIWLASMIVPAGAAAQGAGPPTIDCALGYHGMRADVQSLAGAEWSQEGGYEIATLAVPDRWRVQIAFTAPGHPAHPAVTLRTFRKQVTEVWTAESKGCGYGDQGQFTILMADMKSGDTELTNASRHEVERRKEGKSPLSPAP